MKVLCDNERQKPTFPPFVQQKSAFTLCEPSDKLYICKIPHLSLPHGRGLCVASGLQRHPGAQCCAAPDRTKRSPLRRPRTAPPCPVHHLCRAKCLANGSTNRTFPSPHIEQAHEVSPNSTMYADCRHEHDRLCRPGFCSCPHACRPRPSRRRQRHQRSCGRCHRSGSFRRDHQSERPKRRLLFRRKRRI